MKNKLLAVELGKIIRSARQAKGLSQSDLGRAAGYSDSSAFVTVSRIETGGALPSLSGFVALARVLGLDAAEVVDVLGPYQGDVEFSRFLDIFSAAVAAGVKPSVVLQRATRHGVK